MSRRMILSLHMNGLSICRLQHALITVQESDGRRARPPEAACLRPLFSLPFKAVVSLQRPTTDQASAKHCCRPACELLFREMLHHPVHAGIHAGNGGREASDRPSGNGNHSPSPSPFLSLCPRHRFHHIHASKAAEGARDRMDDGGGCDRPERGPHAHAAGTAFNFASRMKSGPTGKMT